MEKTHKSEQESMHLKLLNQTQESESRLVELQNDHTKTVSEMNETH